MAGVRFVDIIIAVTMYTSRYIHRMDTEHLQPVCSWRTTGQYTCQGAQKPNSTGSHISSSPSAEARKLDSIPDNEAVEAAGHVLNEWGEQLETAGLAKDVDSTRRLFCPDGQHGNQMYVVRTQEHGNIGVFALDASTFGPVYINHVLVFPQHRQKGLLRHVMVAAEKVACDQGLGSVLRLWCDPALEPMYRKLGWVQMDQLVLNTARGVQKRVSVMAKNAAGGIRD